MLNIKERESKNECYISGILNELNIVEGTTSDGRDYVRGTAKIRVDQEINGKITENIIPVSMFSMKLKKDGNPNQVAAKILSYKDSLISMAVAENPAQASKVTLSGKSCNIGENMWYDQKTNQVRSGFNVSCNFLNAKRDSDKERAGFELSGVVLGTKSELDKNGEETGRLIVNFGLIGYGGRIEVVDLIADDKAKAYIESNWEKGDTVNVVGDICVIQKTVTWTEEQGFGEPIERTRTESRRELVITGGSAGGLEESLSYDADEVKAALAERKSRVETTKEKALSKSKSTTATKADNFGF